MENNGIHHNSGPTFWLLTLVWDVASVIDPADLKESYSLLGDMSKSRICKHAKFWGNEKLGYCLVGHRLSEPDIILCSTTLYRISHS